MRIGAVALASAACGVGIGVGVAAAHDTQLDDANAHLVKAERLVQASDPGPISDQAKKKYAQAIAKAMADMEKAQQQIQNAADIADNP
jgi:hypothetical protein